MRRSTTLLLVLPLAIAGTAGAAWLFLGRGTEGPAKGGTAVEPPVEAGPFLVPARGEATLTYRIKATW